MRFPIYQVDAFADAVFGGNPAAVVPLEKSLDAALMQKIALENNLSETAFLVPQPDRGPGHYGLRWFTPAVEVPLCGHATLASAHVLWAHCDEKAERLVFQTKSGDLVISRDEAGLIEMDFPANPVVASADTGPFEALLGVEVVEAFMKPYPMAVLAHAEAVRAVTFEVGRLAEMTGADPVRLIVTAPGDGDHDCVSRFFAPYAGIDEDPVTGSIHTTLVPYWAKRLGQPDIVAHQASARGGTLSCTDGGERVVIRGKAVDYLKGWIEI